MQVQQLNSYKKQFTKPTVRGIVSLSMNAGFKLSWGQMPIYPQHAHFLSQVGLPVKNIIHSPLPCRPTYPIPSG